VGVIVRVPLASGLLSGRSTPSTTFPPGDHRTYNRRGEAFDIGETFSGVPFEVGAQVAGRLARSAVPEGWTLPEVALRWCADAPGVSTVIPGARNPGQARANAGAGSRPRLPDESAALVRAAYDEEIRAYVHDRW
jgi:aryl-alcohol dehydrogenase-like predicted oxidoreductase